MQFINQSISTMRDWLLAGRRGWITLSLLLVLLIMAVLMFWASREPQQMSTLQIIDAQISSGQLDARSRKVNGVATTATLLHIIDTLLHKRAGYLSNDLLPPFVLLDNQPSWEYGVLLQSRDLARVLRNDISRSQTQSSENAHLAVADPALHFDHASWWLPTTESQLRMAARAVLEYQNQLLDESDTRAQFFARADNLEEYLAQVEKRLGDIGQQLSASIGQKRLNTDLSGDASVSASPGTSREVAVKTPWLQIDNVFFQARGTAWALIHIMHALEQDFADVLNDKNAMTSFQQIIRELEATQQPIQSLVILNGAPFGMFPNHSLAMANYIARANASVIDLKQLLDQG
jgi:hypothetical protein